MSIPDSAGAHSTPIAFLVLIRLAFPLIIPYRPQSTSLQRRSLYHPSRSMRKCKLPPRKVLLRRNLYSKENYWRVLFCWPPGTCLYVHSTSPPFEVQYLIIVLVSFSKSAQLDAAVFKISVRLVRIHAKMSCVEIDSIVILANATVPIAGK